MTQTCQHKTLHFGSGGYYILCSEPGCGAAWIAWKMGEDERTDGVRKGQPVCGSEALGERVLLEKKSHGVFGECICLVCGLRHGDANGGKPEFEAF